MIKSLKNLSRFRMAFATVIAILVLSACGLGMDAEARVERGQQAFDSGQFEAAIIDARNVLLEEPENVAARILLSRALIETDDGATAEKEIRRAIELGAPPDDTLEFLGRSLLIQGKFGMVVEEVTTDLIRSEAARINVLRVRAHALVGVRRPSDARELYSVVLQSSNDDVESLIGVVNSYVVERNFVQARATMNEILAQHNNDVAAWLSSASLSMRTRDAARAAQDYSRAVELLEGQDDEPREMRALSGLAEAVLVDGRPDEARVALTRMREIAAKDPRTLLISARLAAVDRDWTAAQGQLQEILNLVPNFQPAQVLLGVVHKESGNLGQAEMYLSAVVAATPENANARRLLAETRLEMNESAAARQAIDSIVSGPNADARSLAIAAAASMDLGEFEDAAAMLERSLAADPRNTELRIELALAYLRSDKIVEAQALLLDLPDDVSEENDFRRDLLLVMLQLTSGDVEPKSAATELLTRWPDQPPAYYLAGSISMSAEEYADARTMFLRSRELAPNDVRPLRYLAQLDEREDDPVAAKANYLQVLELEPSDAAAMVALARIARLSENDTESLEWLEKARIADTSAATPRALLGANYLQSGNFAAAATVAQEGINLDPNDAKLHNVLGYSRLAQNDLSGALAEFSLAVELDPDEPNYALNLARTQDRQGNAALAAATLEESRERTLQHLPSGILLAWLHMRSGDLDVALNVAEELRKIHPEESGPHAVEAEVYLRRGDLAAASAAYGAASAIRMESRFAVRDYQIRRRGNLPDPLVPLTSYLAERPFDSAVRLLVAQALRSSGDDEKAYEQYARILEYDPDNLVAGNNLALGYFKMGDPRAEEVARRAYDSHSNNSAVIDTLGWILVNKGEVNDGITLLRDAVRLNRESRESRFHLASALARTGENQEAKRLLEDILSSDDQFASRAEAERLLETL